MKKKLTKEQKNEMLTVTTLACTQGIKPKNLNTIAPDYVYYEVEGLYINVFLTESISHDTIWDEVFSIKNKVILDEGKKVVKNTSFMNMGRTVVFPTLLNTSVDEIVGAVVSNVRILL